MPASPISAHPLRHVLPSLILFKLSWIALVVWQDRGVPAALLLQGLSLALHPARAPAIRALLLGAVLGAAVDQLLALAGVFRFPGPWLPPWLLVLWLAFANVLTLGLRWIARLSVPWQAAIGAFSGICSYQAGYWCEAVDFGLPVAWTWGVLGVLWAMLLPTLLRITRLPPATGPGSSTVPRNAAGCALLALALAVPALWPTAARSDGEAPHVIGEAAYRYLFWHVYDARLHAATPTFSFPVDTPFALTLEYRRAFTGEQILRETRRQWDRQERDIPAEWESWLETHLPDVDEGDRLTFAVDTAGSAALHFNGELIAQRPDPDFAIAFAGIWLADDTTDRAFRAKLLGEHQ